MSKLDKKCFFRQKIITVIIIRMNFNFVIKILFNYAAKSKADIIGNYYSVLNYFIRKNDGLY